MEALTARDLYSSRSVIDTYTHAVVCASIAVVAMAFRLLSRARSKLGLALDDVFALIALVLFVAFAGCQVWAYKSCGWGKDPSEATPEVLEKFLKSLYIVSPLSTTSIVFGKLAILWLFRRIFGVDRTFRRCVDALIVFCVCWLIAVDGVIFFQCIPVAGGYDAAVREHAQCLNLTLVTVITEPINGFSELLMVLLPVNQIRKLHLPLRQRLGLSFIFSLGLLCVASSIARAVEAYWPGAVTIDLAAQAFWINIQLLMLILVSCLPTYRKLLPENFVFIPTYFRRQMSSLLSRRGGTGTSANGTSARGTRADGGRSRGDYDLSTLRRDGKKSISSMHHSHTTTSGGGGGGGDDAGTQHSAGQTEIELPLEYPTDRIHVKHELSVV